MFKRLFAIITFSFLLGLLLLPCGAAVNPPSQLRSGTLTLYYDRPYLTYSVIDDPDDGFEVYYIEFLNSESQTGWITVEVLVPSDLHANEYSYRIPDSVLDLPYTVYYRMSGSLASGSSVSSNIITISPATILIPTLALSYEPESKTVLLDSGLSIGTATYVYHIWDTYGHETYITDVNKYCVIPSTFYSSWDLPYGTMSVRVSCTYGGQTRYSNILEIEGKEVYTVSLETGYEFPSEIDGRYYSRLLYSGIRNTSLHKYVLSGLMMIIGLGGLVFVIRYTH